MSTLILALTLVVQQRPISAAPPPDTVYETPALAALLSRAAAANREVPEGLASYGARVESELSIVQVHADGRESVLQLEQVASDLSWRADGGLLLELVGYRSQMLGPTFSTLSFFDVPWTVPTLYGERLDLVRSGAPRYTEEGELLMRRAIHPLSDAREDVYRFSGGDTVLVLRLPERTVPIVRVRATPVRMPELPTLLFEGDIDLDATRLHVVGMQGRLFPSHRPRSPLDALAVGVLFIRFESAEYDERYWLPREQRFEAQAISRLAEGRVLFRVISRFVEVRTNDPGAARGAPPADTFQGGRLVGLEDAGRLSGFTGWRVPMGELSASAGALDFDAYAPDWLARARGRPRVSVGARHASSLLRVNHVEGVFTGMGLTFDAGDAAPGLRVRAHGGWAWREATARGGADVEYLRHGWEYIARGARQLVHTHDFLYLFEPEPDVTPVFGAEDFDYVDRRAAALIARRLGARGPGLRFEVARLADGMPGIRTPAEAPDLEAPVRTGAYWRGRAEVRRNPSAGGLSMDPGLMLRLAWEGAAGELEWQRLEAGAALRRRSGRWTLSTGIDAGMVFGADAPPQALFQLGATAETPGFTGHSFAGERAALGRATLMYTLPVLEAPLRIGAMWLPGPAPSPSLGVRFAWTDASLEALERIEAVGWRASEGVRAVMDARLRFFGGSVSVGVARPLERGERWRFVWGLLGGF